jgi:hypothetical protein
MSRGMDGRAQSPLGNGTKGYIRGFVGVDIIRLDSESVGDGHWVIGV